MQAPPAKKVKVSKFRLWTLTVYPPSLTDDPNQPNPINFPDCRWAVASVERCPTTGKLHVQASIMYHNQVTLSHVRNDFGNSGHYEPSKGTAQQNLAYCTKSDTHVAGPWTIGELPKQGKRNDWHNVLTMAKEKKTFSEIVVQHPHLAPAAKGIVTIMEAVLPPPPISREMTVMYLWGPTGVGKTHQAMNKYPDACVIKGKYVDGKSFDQYNNEDTIIFDEWDPSEWPLTLMNSLLDKWKCPLQCRYQNKYARWTTVVITSNHDPNQCYPSHLRATFLRRLTIIKKIMSQDDTI